MPVLDYMINDLCKNKEIFCFDKEFEKNK
jgi:hypothetical protein